MKCSICIHEVAHHLPSGPCTEDDCSCQDWEVSAAATTATVEEVGWKPHSYANEQDAHDDGCVSFEDRYDRRQLTEGDVVWLQFAPKNTHVVREQSSDGEPTIACERYFCDHTTWYVGDLDEKGVTCKDCKEYAKNREWDMPEESEDTQWESRWVTFEDLQDGDHVMMDSGRVFHYVWRVDPGPGARPRPACENTYFSPYGRFLRDNGKPVTCKKCVKWCIRHRRPEHIVARR